MIGIMGNDFFGKRMADAINKTMPAVFLYSSLTNTTFKKKIKDVKIIHYVGSPTVSFHGVLNLIRLKLYGKKIIVHWIGADAWMAENLFFARIFTKLFKNQISLHVAIEKELLKEENIDPKSFYIKTNPELSCRSTFRSSKENK